MHLDGFGGPDVDRLVFRAAPTGDDAGRPMRHCGDRATSWDEPESNRSGGGRCRVGPMPPLAVIGSFHAKKWVPEIRWLILSQPFGICMSVHLDSTIILDVMQPIE